MKRAVFIYPLCCAFLAVFGVFAPMPARAVDKADVMVALKTTPLLTNKLSGSVTMAVVFDPANAESKAEADALKGILDAGVEAPGGVKISALMVPMGEASAQLANAKLTFIAKGACTDAVSSAASAAGTLSMATDLSCVKSNKCVLGVVSKPSVEIYYSKAAAEAAKVGFAQAFTMLAKQI